MGPEMNILVLYACMGMLTRTQVKDSTCAIPNYSLRGKWNMQNNQKKLNNLSLRQNKLLQ